MFSFLPNNDKICYSFIQLNDYCEYFKHMTAYFATAASCKFVLFDDSLSHTLVLLPELWGLKGSTLSK